MKIRDARADDIRSLIAMDHIAQVDEKKRTYIEVAVRDGECVVALDGEVVIGYGVLDYSFFENGMIDMLYVDASWRRRGAGSQLIREIERRCTTPKLFTSTNMSNLPMQALLRKLGYLESGVVFNLDPGDPELFFFKLLR